MNLKSKIKEKMLVSLERKSLIMFIDSLSCTPQTKEDLKNLLKKLIDSGKYDLIRDSLMNVINTMKSSSFTFGERELTDVLKIVQEFGSEIFSYFKHQPAKLNTFISYLQYLQSGNTLSDKENEIIKTIMSYINT